MTPIGNRRSPIGNGAASSADNPWPGLAPFTEDQAGLFHGRDAEIRDLTRRAERNALTVLFGQSGLGKSSLLQAGVFPRLRASGYWPIYVRLDHDPGAPTPTEQIKAMVHAATARAGTWTKPGSAKPGESLWEFFHHRDDKLVSPTGRTIVPVLIFDQFEELFTLGQGAGAERARAVAFIGELAELVENRPSEKLVARLEESSAEMDAFDFSRTDYRVVITLREDFLPHLESLKTIMPALMENRLRLARMTGTQALEAVVKPGGALVTAEVAQAIVEFVAGAKGGSAERLAELDVEPPLLSVICRELNERRKALGQAQITGDLVSGNRREILTDFYERSVADLPEGMRTFVEDKLLTKSGFRDNLALETALEEPGVTRPLIDTLVARRLLRIEDRLGVQRVELTHDVLAEVIRASRDTRQRRTADTENRRRTRRLRLTIAGLTAAVVVVSAAAITGLRAQRNSAAAERRRAAQEASRTDQILASNLLAEGKTADGLAYLVRAAKRDPDNQVIAPRILSVLTSRNFMLPVGQPLQLPSPAVGRHLLSDGTTLLVRSADNVIRAIDLAQWKVVHEFKFDRPLAPDLWAVARNVPHLAVGFADGSFQVWDVASRQPLGAPFRHGESDPASVLKLHFSPDAQWLAVGEEGRTTLWNAPAGSRVVELPIRGARLTFSPDGRLIAGSVQPRPNSTATHAQVWNCADGSPVGGPIAASGAPLTWIEFGPDGRLGIGKQNSAAVYTVPDGVSSLVQLPYVGITGVFTPDGRHVLRYRDREVEVIEVATGRPAYAPLRHDGPVTGVSTALGGALIFSTCVDGVPRLWDRGSGALLTDTIRRHDHSTEALLTPDGVHVVAFAKDGTLHRLQVDRGAVEPLVLPRRHRVDLHFFDNERPHELLRVVQGQGLVAVDVASGMESTSSFIYPYRMIRGASTAVQGIISNDQTRLLIHKGAGTWAVWKFPGATRPPAETELEGRWNQLSAYSVSFHPTGEYASLSADRIGRIYDVSTGKALLTLNPPEGLGQLRFSPAGSVFGYLRLDGPLYLGEFPSGKTLHLLPVPAGRRFARWWFSPDSSRAITTDRSGGLQFWEVATGRMLGAVQAHRATSEIVIFSPDGSRLLTGSLDGTVQTWSIATMKPEGPKLEHPAAVTSAIFAPDGRRVVTATQSGQIRVWDSLSGTQLCEPYEHPAAQQVATTRLVLSPDGRFVVSDRTGAAHRVWPMPPAESAGTPPWLLRLTSVAANRAVSDSGEISEAVSDAGALEALRREIAGLPASDYARWAAWFLAPAGDRPTAPGFTITRREAQVARTVGDRAAQVRLLEERSSELVNSSAQGELLAVQRELIVLAEQSDEAPERLARLRYGYAVSLVRNRAFGEAESQALLVLQALEDLDDSRFAALQTLARATLGAAIAGQKRYEEAEVILTEALEEIFGQPLSAFATSVRAREELRRVVMALVELYETTARPEKAAAWRTRAAALQTP